MSAEPQTRQTARAGEEKATIAAAFESAEHIRRRQLEKSVDWTGREWLRCLWYRVRLTVSEMNYATRRIVQLQAPWISDEELR